VYFICGAIGWNKAHWGSMKATVLYSVAPLLYFLGVMALFGLL
jgi:hypothetical protein